MPRYDETSVSQTLADAIITAAGAHAEHVDKQGQPYILHVLRVMLAGKTPDEQVVGALHDTLEDTLLLPASIEEAFGPTILAAVEALTRRKALHEPYDDYITRVLTNPLARTVKRYDVEDHLSRVNELSSEDKERLIPRYRRALLRITGAEAA